MKPVGRLAPSPTGAQHLGNARTYLLAWLSARSRNGRVILRVEDIDSPRVKPWATQQAIDDLRWLGLDWDEGPDVGGPHAPYIQTERAALYVAALQRLIQSDRVYPCTCTRTDIDAAASAPHESIDGPVYPGTCSKWKLGDPQPQPGTFCWRLRTTNVETVVTDRLHGSLTMNVAKQLGDFPVTRKSDQAAYQLAVVVDDEAMGVTEVVRGDDLIPSALRQRELQIVLGFKTPECVHVPLVVGRDGRRLAKRHGDTRLSTFRKQGVRPEQIVGWAAYSAGLIKSETPVSARSLLADFDWSRVSRSRVQVDSDRFFGAPGSATKAE
jgi:glutamyl-tRNA synthetase